MINLEEIKNVILDLGGVILELDIDLTIEGFKKLGVPDFEDLDIILSKYPFFELFETGKISPEEYRDEIRKASGNNLTDQEIDNTWNAMSLGFKQDTIETVKKLGGKYRLFLLSNTNAIHEITYNKQLMDDHGIHNLSMLFEKVYYSHILHLRKPDPEIFKFVLADSDLIPEDTLYIDDTLVHIKSAESLGIQAYHLKAPERITDIF